MRMFLVLFSLLLSQALLISCVSGSSSSSVLDQKCTAFHVVTCDTSEISTENLFSKHLKKTDGSHKMHRRTTTHFARPVNVCSNTTTQTYNAKLNGFIQYARDVQEVKSYCEPVLIFLDGPNFLFNHGVKSTTLLTKWAAMNTDVLVSTDMTCTIDKQCTSEDVQKYYSKDTSPSPFVGSVFMGTAAATVDVLSNGKFFQLTDSLTGQNAMTMLGTQSTETKWRIKKDTEQSIIGSFVYTQKNPASCPNSNKPLVEASCYDILNAKFEDQCCTNADIDIATQMSMFTALTDGTCDIVRSPGLPEGSTPENGKFFYSQVFSKLNSHPFVWHGYSHSETFFKALHAKVFDCKMKSLNSYVPQVYNEVGTAASNDCSGCVIQDKSWIAAPNKTVPDCYFFDFGVEVAQSSLAFLGENEEDSCRFAKYTDIFPKSWYHNKVCPKQTRAAVEILEKHAWSHLKEKGFQRNQCKAILVEPSSHFDVLFENVRQSFPQISIYSHTAIHNSGCSNLKFNDDKNTRSSILTGGEMTGVRVINLNKLLYATVTQADYVIVKVDIEGGEYDMIPCLEKSPSLELIDQLFLERHDQWVSTEKAKALDVSLANIAARGINVVQTWP